MEKIFLFETTDAYVEEMEAYIEEVIEDYKGQRNFHSGERLLGMRLLEMIYLYTKEQNPEKWTTAFLLDQLTLIAFKKEIYYLRGKKAMTERIRLYIDNFDKNGHEKMFFFLGHLLWYYYRISEKGCQDTEYNQKVEESYQRFNRVMNYLRHTEFYKAKRKAVEVQPNKLPIIIKEKIDEKVFGQDEAKKTLIMAILSFLKGGSQYRAPIMLCGATGTGKTYLLQTLAEIDEWKEKLCFLYYTSTELTKNGFTGDDIKDVFKKFRTKSRGRKGIIFFDEFDKLLAYKSSDRNGNDVNESIVHDILTAVSGNSSDYVVDTNDILFVFGGAFENLENLRRERVEKVEMGFGPRLVEKHNVQNEINHYDIRQELMNIKSSRQFLGRIGKVVMMEPLSRDSLRKILIDEKFGVLTRKREEFSMWNLELDWEDSYIEAAIDEIEKSNQGARYATSIVEKSIGTSDFDMCMRGETLLTLRKEHITGESLQSVSA